MGVNLDNDHIANVVFTSKDHVSDRVTSFECAGIGVGQELLAPWVDAVETVTNLDSVGDQAADALFAGTT